MATQRALVFFVKTDDNKLALIVTYISDVYSDDVWSLYIPGAGFVTDVFAWHEVSTYISRFLPANALYELVTYTDSYATDVDNMSAHESYTSAQQNPFIAIESSLTRDILVSRIYTLCFTDV